MNYQDHLKKLSVSTMCQIIIKLYEYDNETTLMHEIADAIRPHFDDIVSNIFIDIAESRRPIEESIETLNALDWLSQYCYLGESL